MSEHGSSDKTQTVSDPDRVIGEFILKMVDGLKFAPSCNAQWYFELDDIEYEVTLKRKK